MSAAGDAAAGVGGGRRQLRAGARRWSRWPTSVTAGSRSTAGPVPGSETALADARVTLVELDVSGRVIVEPAFAYDRAECRACRAGRCPLRAAVAA